MKESKQMNISLWTIQILLAVYTIIGALYMMSNYRDIATVWALHSLSQPMWMILGVLQIIFSLGLFVPALMKKSPQLTVISGVGLAVLSLLGIWLYLSYARFPGMLWGIIPAVLAAFVAYKRLSK